MTTPASATAASSPADALGVRLRDRTARVGVIGLGYVGLPLAVEFARAGFDVDRHRRRRRARSPTINGGAVLHPRRADRRRRRAAATPARLRATTDSGDRRRRWTRSTSACRRRSARPRTRTCPTSSRPSRRSRRTCSPGSSSSSSRRPIRARPTKSCSRCSSANGLRSRARLLPRVLARARRSGQRAVPRRSNIPKVVGGIDADVHRARARALRARRSSTVVPVSSPRVAEMVKLLENTFRAVNIGLVNELALMCDRLGIDVWEVIDAATTKPFGFMPFYPGPGLGGHCIPIDPFYLSWKAQADRLRGALHRARRPRQRRDAGLRRATRSPTRSTAQRKPVQRLARARRSASPTSATSTTCASRRRST